MDDLSDIHSDVVEVSETAPVVAIREEDFEAARALQAKVDALTKYRQELGRLDQVHLNLTMQANELEKEVTDQRRGLAAKYGLVNSAPQWAVDFEKKVFVPLSPRAPVIP